MELEEIIKFSTVGNLRKAIETVPDKTPVIVMDGYSAQCYAYFCLGSVDKTRRTSRPHRFPKDEEVVFFIQGQNSARRDEYRVSHNTKYYKTTIW